MGIPGIITGGDGATSIASLFRDTTEDSSPLSRQGVFGRHPGSTSKNAVNRGRRDAEHRESMARLFVEIPGNDMEAFMDTVSAETRPLARILATAADGSGTGGTGFLDFLLTSAQEPFAEKAQIVDTLTDNYVAFYSGQAPPLFQYRGTLLNTYQDDQRVWMLRLYREILRGTRLANRNLIVRLRYDSFIVSGYMENLTLSIRGETEHTASEFAFSLRVKRLNIVTAALGSPTVAQTPATTNSILTGENETPFAAARSGVVTPEVPPTSLLIPGAGNALLSERDEARIRERLQAVGRTDAQIDTALQSSNAASALFETGSSIDFRELNAQAANEGRYRVGESVQGLDAQSSNLESIMSDGQGGMSNVRGTLSTGSSDDSISASLPAGSQIAQTNSGDGSFFSAFFTPIVGGRRRGGVSG